MFRADGNTFPSILGARRAGRTRLRPKSHRKDTLRDVPHHTPAHLRMHYEIRGGKLIEEDDMSAYNLFRNTGPDGLCCAVPEERSVPRFVVGPHWEFEGRVDGKEAPLGFDDRAASAGVRFNGFYLFASFRKDCSDQ